MLTVTLDGEPLDCPSAQPDGILRATGYPYGGLLWRCSDVPRSGRVVVTLRPLEGAPTSLRYGGRGWPPTWVGETGRHFSARAVDDSLFLEEVSP
jgi:hypothetical protein